MATDFKKKRYVIWSNEILDKCIKDIRCRGVDGQFEITINEVSKDKTLKQLGALFGLWVIEEASRMGESEKYVHKKWKAWFLARVYFIEQLSVEQEMWVDHFEVLKNSGNQEEFEKHSKRISLSWSTLSQMKHYMAAIEQHYMAEGRPLSIPDRHYKMWNRNEMAVLA